MSTLTVYADAADGYIQSGNSVYTTARSGSGLTAVTTGDLQRFGATYLGGVGPYACSECMVGFDTSAVGSGDEIITAVFSSYRYYSMDYSGNPEGNTRVWNLWAYDWGSDLTTVDWVDWTSSPSLTKVASHTGTFTPSAYTDWDSLEAFLAAITSAGTTRLMLSAEILENGTAPTSDMWGGCYTANKTGTTYDPKLYIEYSVVPVSKTLAFGVNAAETLRNTANHRLVFEVRGAQALAFVTGRSLVFGVNVAATMAGILSVLTNKALAFGVNAQHTVVTSPLFNQAITLGVGVGYSLENVTELGISFGVRASHTLVKVTSLLLAFGLRVVHTLRCYYQGKGYGPLTCEVIRAGLDAEVIHE